MKHYFNPWYYMIGNTVIKKLKPCGPDDYVHITLWGGCYRVIQSRVMYFTIMKDRKEVRVTWDKFVCLKGRGQSAEAQIKRGIKSALKELEKSSACNARVMTLLEEKLKELRR